MYLGRFSRYLYVPRFSRPDYLWVKKKDYVSDFLYVSTTVHLCIHLPVIHEASRIRIVQFEGFFFFHLSLRLPLSSSLSVCLSASLSHSFSSLSPSLFPLPLFFLSLSTALYNHARRAFAMRHISPKNPSYASCASTALGIYTKFFETSHLDCHFSRSSSSSPFETRPTACPLELPAPPHRPERRPPTPFVSV